MKKNRETWASLVDQYQTRMIESIKLVERHNEIIEEAKSESEEDSASEVNETSSDNFSLTEVEEEQKSTSQPV